MRLLVINGPNLNLLGTRSPEIYGSTTLDELDAMCREWAGGAEIESFQSNHEGELIDRLHAAQDVDGIVFNPGALSHTSYALHDAVEAVAPLVVEVHISNIVERESWRRHSVVSPACIHSIYGRGIDGYRWAIDYLSGWLRRNPTRIAFGSHADQFGLLRLPDSSSPHRTAVLLHGGFWRHQWTHDTIDRLAVDLADRGWATWNVEYRRLGTGGGWPGTLEDVAAAIDHLAELEADLDLTRVVIVGHSAGGHLALWTAARGRVPLGSPGAQPGVEPALVVGLAPVADLEDALAENLGDGAVAAFLGGGGDAALSLASPSRLLPFGIPQIIAHGELDGVVPIRHGRSYAELAAAAGEEVTFLPQQSSGHIDWLDPTSSAWESVVAKLE